MLPSQRNRRRDNAELDAAGADWALEIDYRARQRIAELWDIMDEKHLIDLQRVGRILRAHGGWGANHNFMSLDLVNCKTPLYALDMVAAGATATASEDHRRQYEDSVNDVFNEHRIGYKFIDGELVAYQDDELMQESVEPALRLLVGEKFDKAHQSYLAALHQISQNEAGNAITDAATALQETLEALGCQGKDLGKLITDARKKGMFGPQDSPMTEGIHSIVRWVASDRNQIGDAHRFSPARREDAWLIVHVVGAIIVRLAEGSSRPEPKK